VQRSKKINLHNLTINADFCLYKSAALCDSGIVDKKVDAAVSSNDFSDGRIAVAFIDNVAINADGISTACPEFIRCCPNSRLPTALF